MSRPEVFLTSAEVADRFRTSAKNIVQLCRDGKIPATKPLGTWLIPASWVEQQIEAGSNQKVAS